ncbi:MAG: RdgB/HAM1 family non-canonical purine NTP pyrophosphatase [Slackia sp.]
MKQVVIATNNAHKVEEIRAALDFEGWEFLTLSECDPYDESVEDADSFEGNARIKARAAFEHTGLAALADDSGLAVDALDGAPGVLSARYSGVHGDDAANNAKLLRELEGVADAVARPVRVLARVHRRRRHGDMRIGDDQGRIAHGLSGDGGFGYDPLFLPDEFQGAKSLAEVTQDEKNAISHRGIALRSLKEKLS